MDETKIQKEHRILVYLLDEYFKAKDTLRESAFKTFQQMAEKESGKFS